MHLKISRKLSAKHARWDLRVELLTGVSSEPGFSYGAAGHRTALETAPLNMHTCCFRRMSSRTPAAVTSLLIFASLLS